MIAELKEYNNSIDSGLTLPCRGAVEACISYLEAMRNMFEQGTLSKIPIASPNAPPIRNMEKSMEFVKHWHNQVHRKGAFERRIDQSRAFWANETFDNFRYLYYGMKKLVDAFVERFPSYYLVLHRISGSSVESLFSALRYYSSGNLTSINYGPLLGRVRNIENSRLINRKRRMEEYLNEELAFKKLRN